MFQRTFLNDNQAAALVAAGRLLQSKTWPNGARKIECRAGETYPQAVYRVIHTLSIPDRDFLRAAVAWVLDYQCHDRRQAEHVADVP